MARLSGALDPTAGCVWFPEGGGCPSKEMVVLRDPWKGSGGAGGPAAPRSCAGRRPSLRGARTTQGTESCPLSLCCSASGSGHPCSWGLRLPDPPRAMPKT